MGRSHRSLSRPLPLSFSPPHLLPLEWLSRPHKSRHCLCYPFIYFFHPNTATQVTHSLLVRQCVTNAWQRRCISSRPLPPSTEKNALALGGFMSHTRRYPTVYLANRVSFCQSVGAHPMRLTPIEKHMFRISHEGFFGAHKHAQTHTLTRIWTASLPWWIAVIF